jgi:hypothetical protein
LSAFLLLAAWGCESKLLPDPNDPKMVGVLQPDILDRDMGDYSDQLLMRMGRGEITPDQYHDLLAKAASHYLGDSSILKVDPPQAWRYAHVMMTARRWNEAQELLKIAVEWAKQEKNEDRRINDSLRLAEVDANLNQIPEAIEMTKSTFNAKPVDSAPILYGVLYSIVPAARGKGHDIELAQLLDQAVTIHMHTVVNRATKEGRDFEFRRADHISLALTLESELYTIAGKKDLAGKALQRKAQLLAQLNSTGSIMPGYSRPPMSPDTPHKFF